MSYGSILPSKASQLFRTTYEVNYSICCYFSIATVHKITKMLLTNKLNTNICFKLRRESSHVIIKRKSDLHTL